MSYGSYFGWAPRKTVGQRRAESEKLIKAAAKRGRPLAPVVIDGKKIATTFWGQAWCDNLERYRDFAYRLDRGRSYVRSGSVIDLSISAGRVTAKVSGSELYDVDVAIDAVPTEAWRAIQRDCAGSIGSLVDLLAGTLSEAVMVRLCAERTGLFPTPTGIRFTCSCPDYAIMCKHVAAAMYGVGARLDRSPELLFTLRKVSADDLLASVARDLPSSRKAPASARVLSDDAGLAALFGIEMAAAPAAGREPTPPKAKAKATARKPMPPRAPAKPEKPDRKTAKNTKTSAKQPRARSRR